MALQIANPIVVEKIERLAREIGSTKTGAVEQAVDRLLAEQTDRDTRLDRIRALLEQMDRIPERSESFDPLEWDEHGLPR